MKLVISVVSTLLVASCCAAPQQGPDSTTENIDKLIKEVFIPNPNGGFGIPGTGGAFIEQTPAPNRLGEENCECTPYYLCQNDTINDSGDGIIDIRLSGGACDDYLDVCCKPPNIKPTEEKITPRPQIRKGCGKRNEQGIGFRITGAKDGEAQFGEFPWMVAILKAEAVGSNGELLNVYQCGGALIHPSVVLTAAHCVNGKAASALKVRAGEWDTQTKNEVLPHQDRQVGSFVVHEKFHTGALHNDFALLRLTQPVDLADNVDFVCLPEFNVNFDYERCFASGWGKDIFGKEGHYQVILKKVELPVVPHDTCENQLKSTRLGKYFRLDRSFICAGGEFGKDTCRGDGGSPLVCPVRGDPSRFLQAGMVAWGIGCGENQVPGVYANVAYARSWIDQNMALWGFDSREYTYYP